MVNGLKALDIVISFTRMADRISLYSKPLKAQKKLEAKPNSHIIYTVMFLNGSKTIRHPEYSMRLWKKLTPTS